MFTEEALYRHYRILLFQEVVLRKNIVLFVYFYIQTKNWNKTQNFILRKYVLLDISTVQDSIVKHILKPKLYIKR